MSAQRDQSTLTYRPGQKEGGREGGKEGRRERGREGGRKGVSCFHRLREETLNLNLWYGHVK